MNSIVIVESVAKALGAHLAFFTNPAVKLLSAATNNEVLDLHRKHHVKLIINELALPGMNGRELCSIIRKENDLRAAAIITVCPDVPSAKALMADGCVNSVFTKPLQPEMLRKKAYEFLLVNQRESYRIAVSITVDGARSGSSILSHSENISATGMLLQSRAELAMGDRIVCAFFLPDKTRIETDGTIVRVDQDSKPGIRRYGVKFSHQSFQTRKMLESFVNTWSHATQFGTLGNKKTV